MTPPADERHERAGRSVSLSTVAGGAVADDDDSRAIQHLDWPLLAETSLERDGATQRARLLAAGQDLAKALDEVARDVASWKHMGTGAAETSGPPVLSFRREMQLREIMHHDDTNSNDKNSKDENSNDRSANMRR